MALSSRARVRAIIARSIVSKMAAVRISRVRANFDAAVGRAEASVAVSHFRPSGWRARNPLSSAVWEPSRVSASEPSGTLPRESGGSFFHHSVRAKLQDSFIIVNSGCMSYYTCRRSYQRGDRCRKVLNSYMQLGR